MSASEEVKNEKNLKNANGNAPVMTKKTIFEFLDFKSKCKMTESYPVNWCLSYEDPITVDDLSLTIHPDVIRIDCASSHIIPVPGIPTQVIIDDFMLVFKNPKSTFDFFDLSCWEYPDEERHEEIMRPLIAGFNALPHDQLISVVTFKLQLPNVELQDYLAILKRCQPGILKRIVIQYPLKNVGDWSAITETKQWKQAKVVYISHQSGLTIDHFLKFDTILTSFPRLSCEDIGKIVESFRSGTRPFGAFFRMFVGIRFNFEEILNKCNITAPDEPIYDETRPNPGHTARYKLPMENQTLLVFFHYWRIEGKIVHTDNIFAEGKVCLYSEMISSS